jgi:hypothetical protein
MQMNPILITSLLINSWFESSNNVKYFNFRKLIYFERDDGYLLNKTVKFLVDEPINNLLG